MIFERQLSAADAVLYSAVSRENVERDAELVIFTRGNKISIKSSIVDNNEAVMQANWDLGETELCKYPPSLIVLCFLFYFLLRGRLLISSITSYTRR